MTTPHDDHLRPRRRDLLVWGSGALAAASLSGCSFLSTEKKTGAAKKVAGKGKESPALAKLVKTGKLPKLSERLPKNPLVVQPTDKVGVYGGTFHSVMLNATDTPWLGRTAGYEPLLRWDPTGTKVVPGIAASVEPSSDSREFTIKLREGMKWSDGEPFNADDLVFAYQDVVLNKELNPITPDYLTSDGKPVELTKVDDITVKVTFDKPNGLFFKKLAYQGHLIAPRHYLQKFHKKYNADADADAKKQKLAAWTDLFSSKNDQWGNADKPTLCAWMVKNPLGQGNRVVLERNPYYWKTDPDGSQLPYIDEAIYELNSDTQVILLKATNGELGMSTRHINTLQNKPVLGQARSKGKFHFVTLENTVMNDLVISLNLTHKDPVKRKIFQNKDFRIGLSHAINRPEMIKAVWQRSGVPWQAAPDDRSEFYDEEFAKQYTDYDPDKANAFLDKAGLTKKDAQGFRLRPDGKRLFIQVEVATPSLTPVWSDGTQMATEAWKKVGVDAQTKGEDRSLFYERKDANQADAVVWIGDGGLKLEMLECRWWFPFTNESNYAPLWWPYYTTRGKEGEKPPPQTLKQMQLYYELTDTADEGKQKDLLRQIIQIAKEQFYAIGTVRVPNSYGIVKDNFHNVPKEFPEASVMSTPALTNPEQWYIA